MSNSYDEVIIFLHKHYKEVKETHNMLLAIDNKQQQATCIDCSRNENPAYWCKKLPTKEHHSGAIVCGVETGDWAIRRVVTISSRIHKMEAEDGAL
ncbi:MAG: hypothetical protein ACKPKO_63760 [Candidatus Fonsibacter sp.]